MCQHMISALEGALVFSLTGGLLLPVLENTIKIYLKRRKFASAARRSMNLL